MRIPKWYTAATCWSYGRYKLARAHLYAVLARSARGRGDSAAAAHLLITYRDCIADAAAYYNAYIIGCSAPVVDAPAVDYTVWGW